MEQKLKKGDTVVCIIDCSGQGGYVKVGDTGLVDDAHYGTICPGCIDFQREDGTYAHVPAECFTVVGVIKK